MPDLAPGVEFAGHRIEEVAGRGGMGVVYRATQLALDHEVALKVISPDLAGDEVFRKRFISECRAAVSIRHPNVVPIHHAGEEEGLLFVTMALIGGSDLRKVLNADRALRPERAVGIVAQVAAALDAAHAGGLIHRDVKPGNVLIEPRAGGGEHIYLTDFGLTKRLGGEQSRMTATGAFVGTIDYVAPEQIQGGDLDARTDVYALGCVLYEMLTGRTPFGDRDDKIAKIYGHVQDPPTPLRELAPHLSAGFQRVIDRALAKDPADRYPSAGDLARAAISAAEGSEVTEPERAVATGQAAIVDDPTIASESARPTAAEEPTAVTGGGDDRGRRGPGPRLRFALGFAAVGAIAAIAAIALSGGGDGGGGGEGNGSGREPRVQPLIGVNGFPVGVAVAGDDSVWVASRTGGKVTRVPADGSEPNPIELPRGAAPEGMVEADERMWVAAARAGIVPVPLEGSAAETPIDDGPGAPKGIALDPEANRLWASDGGAGVWRADLEPGSSAEPFAVGAELTHGVVVAAGSLWVTDRAGDAVIEVPLAGPATASEPIDVGCNPKGIDYVPATGEVWVVNTDDDTIQPVSITDREAGETVEVGETPRDVVFGADFLWVSNGGDGTVTRVDPGTGESLRLDDVCASPEDIAFGGDSVWVACGAGGDDARSGVVEIRP